MLSCYDRALHDCKSIKCGAAERTEATVHSRYNSPGRIKTILHVKGFDSHSPSFRELLSNGSLAIGAGEAKECDDAASDRGSGKGDEEAPYEFSLDPDTKAAEKKLRRAVAKQVATAFRNTVILYDVAFISSSPIGQYARTAYQYTPATPMITVSAKVV